MQIKSRLPINQSLTVFHTRQNTTATPPTTRSDPGTKSTHSQTKNTGKGKMPGGKKWENRAGAQKNQKPESFQFISLLQALERLKLHLHKREEMLKLLDGSEPKLPAEFLLEFMFEIVLRKMNGQNENSLIPGVSSEVATGSTGAERQATIAVKRDQQTETIQI